MFKNMIAPVQAWLLFQGRCVGCGMPLLKATKQQSNKATKQMINCKCGRVYVKDEKTGRFRRALLSEV